MNSRADYEPWCAWSYGYGHEALIGTVHGIIETGAPAPNADDIWENVLNVDFAPSGVCQEDPEIHQRLRIYFFGENEPEFYEWACPAGHPACMDFSGVYADPNREHPEFEQRAARIYLNEDAMYSKDVYLKYLMANQEVGHALGLGVDDSFPECSALSVMHSGCLTYGPTDWDIVSVTSLMPDGPSQDYSNWNKGF
jgi:hypothetical protein